MVKIEISNRAVYSLLAILIIILAGISVYAVTAVPSPSAHPNPGHSTDELGVPAGCGAGDFFYWDGTQWDCKNVPSSQWAVYSGGIPMAPQNPDNIYEYGDVGIGAIPASDSKLYVYTSSSNSIKGSSSSGVGLYGTGGDKGIVGSNSNGNFGWVGSSSYGVYGKNLNGPTGYLGGSSNAVYGYASSCHGGGLGCEGSGYAGYFNGDLYVKEYSFLQGPTYANGPLYLPSGSEAGGCSASEDEGKIAFDYSAKKVMSCHGVTGWKYTE